MQTCQTISFEELSLSPPFSFSAAVVSPQIIAVSFGTLISISRPIRIQETLLREISPVHSRFRIGRNCRRSVGEITQSVASRAGASVRAMLDSNRTMPFLMAHFRNGSFCDISAALGDVCSWG